MRKIKSRTIINILFTILVILVAVYNEKITTYIVNNYIYNKNATIEIDKNEYSLNRDYKYVQITSDFVARDYQHLLNIIYTILDSGQEEFYFYCSDKYKTCTEDIDKLIPSDNNDIEYDVLSDINNLVHPFNSYKKLTVVMNNYGKVIIKVNKQYSIEDIKYINQEIDKINKAIITEDMTPKLKIQTFHDYIIKTTVYDKARANNMNSDKYKDSESHTAKGLLKNHISLCGGYSDIMSIYIHRLSIPNIRISADKHVWNLIRLEDKWLHLDATWDDPVTSTGSQILLRDYFLIDSERLAKLDTVEHNYNKEFYKEAN